MIVKDDQDEPLAPVSRWVEEVGAIYDLASAGPRVIFQEAGFLSVGPEMIQRIQAEAGLRVAGFLHIMDTDSIRHIIKRHGDQKEVLRGQIPLVRDDFILIPEVFGEPEMIENGGKTKQGRDTVCYLSSVSRL